MLFKGSENNTWYQQQLINDCLSICLDKNVSLSAIEWLDLTLNYELPDTSSNSILSTSIEIINHIIKLRLESVQIDEIIDDVRIKFGCRINKESLSSSVNSWLNLGSKVSLMRREAILTDGPLYDHYLLFSELWKRVGLFEELEAPLPRNWQEFDELFETDLLSELKDRPYTNSDGEQVLRKL